jgi:hypothetical protein
MQPYPDNSESNFKDIEFNDPPEIIYSSYQIPPPTFNDMQFPNIPSNVNPVPAQSSGAASMPREVLEAIQMRSRVVKWTSLVLSIFAFLYILPGAIPLILTFVFPILGFIAAHKYNDCLVKFYSVYLVLIVIVQIIVMAVIGGTAYIVFQTFVIVSEIVILVYNIQLSRGINNLTLGQKKILTEDQKGNIS